MADQELAVLLLQTGMPALNWALALGLAGMAVVGTEMCDPEPAVLSLQTGMHLVIASRV